MKGTIPDFDRIAPYHDRLARIVFGPTWLTSQTCFLDEVSACRKILVLGGGTGNWLPHLLSKNPTAEIWYVDLSEIMIARARSRATSAQIHFIQGDAVTMELPEADCVITFYFLDVFPESALAGLVEKIRSRLRPGSKWLVTDFVSEKWWHRLVLVLMYKFFQLIANLQNNHLPHWEMKLNEAGLNQVRAQTFYGGFMKAVVWRA